MIYSEEMQLNEFVTRLRDQEEVPLWIFASNATVAAIYKGESEIFGPRGIWFRRLFNLLGLSYGAELVLTFIGVIVSTLWWFRCRNVAQIKIDAEYLFIGFGAGSEEELLASFKNEVQAQVGYLNQARHESLAQVAKPKLSALWRNSYHEAKKTVRSLSQATTPIIRDHLQHWLVSAAIRFSTYLYIRSWADALPSHIKKVVFIAADIPAFALLDSSAAQRITVEYRQHGFLLRSILFPPFHRLIALNSYEAKHLSACLPGSVVIEKSQTIPLSTIDNQRQLLLFASIYDHGVFSKADHITTINAIFQWFSTQKCLPVVRPHPCETGNFWQKSCQTIALDLSIGGFQGALENHLPLFVISWWSTCLFDALKSGVIPILIMEGSQPVLDAMVFPLAEIALNWPRDLDLIQQLIGDPDLYRQELKSRQFAAFGALN